MQHFAQPGLARSRKPLNNVIGGEMPPPIGHHVMCRLVDSRVIAPTTQERRLVSRIVLAKCRKHRLLCFNVPDTHLHLVIAEMESICNELTRRIEITVSLQMKLKVGFAKAHPKPILDQQHLFQAFDYVLRQQPRHNLEWDPYHEASNLSDMLGLRVIGQYTATNVRHLLPRVQRPDLLARLGVDDLVEADGPVGLLVPATLAATGRPHLRGRDLETHTVWRAMLAVVEGSCTLSRLAGLVGVHRNTLARVKKLSVDLRLFQAIRLQLGLRLAVAERPAGVFVAESRR
jgi:hypothetical protein